MHFELFKNTDSEYYDVSISDNNIVFSVFGRSAIYIADINTLPLSPKLVFSEIIDPDISPGYNVFYHDISGENIVLAINGYTYSDPVYLATPEFTLERVGTIEGGSPIGDILPGVNSAERQVHFNLLGHSDDDPLHKQWNGKPVWIVIHGWNDDPNGNDGIARLAETVKNSIGNEGIVLTLDWSEASNVGNSEDPFSFQNGDNGTAASWIALVADFAVQQLKDWGLNDGNQLNLIGHSLGSFLSAEIASQFTTANTITALDPASESNRLISPSFDDGYDIDGSMDGIQRPKRFDEVSSFSRSFLGSKSIAGDAEFASWADESILVDYGSGIGRGSEHSLIVDTYTQLVDSDPNQRKLTDDIFSLKYSFGNVLKRNSYSSTKLSTEFKEFEGILDVRSANNEIRNLTGLNPFLDFDRDTDEIIYGTNKSDRLTGNTGQDFLVGGAGRDRLNGGTDNDILFGGEGKDVLQGTPINKTVNRFFDKDLFVFEIDKNRGFNTNKIGVDIIRDFDSRVDKIVLQGQPNVHYTRDQLVKQRRTLTRKEFAQIEVSKSKSQRLAGREEAKIVFNKQTGQVFCNPNGQRRGFGDNGGHFATLLGTDALSSLDFLV